MNAKFACRRDLGQTAFPDDAGNRDRQLGLCQKHIGVREAEIGKDVPQLEVISTSSLT